MSEEQPEEFLAVDLDLTQLGQDLDRAEQAGVKLADLFAEKWHKLEVDTNSGRITLSRANPSDPNSLQDMEAIESEDPAIKAGDIVLIDGIAMGQGSSGRPGSIGPQARMSFRKKVILEYRLGDHNKEPAGGEPGVMTQSAMDGALAELPEATRRTEQGLELSHYASKPRSTDFVSHALVVEAADDGAETSRYLF